MTTERNWVPVGMTEAAELLGVSPARLRKLREDDDKFPTPVRPLAMGPVYDEADFLEYKRQREEAVNKGGRPKKTDSA